jgi:hypothetical protein
MLEFLGVVALVTVVAFPAIFRKVRGLFGGGYAPGTGTPAALPAEWSRWNGARPEVAGAPANTILAVPGLVNVPTAARQALLDVAQQLQVGVDVLAILIGHESGWQPGAIAKNKQGKPIAFGLIQLTEGGNLAGFTGAALAAVASMPPDQQLRKVALPYFQRVTGLAGMNPGQIMMQNFLPKYEGEAESYVLASRGDLVFTENAGLAGLAGGSADQITVGDVYAAAAKSAAQAGRRRMCVDGTIVGGAQSAPPAPSATRPSIARTATPASTSAPTTASTAPSGVTDASQAAPSAYGATGGGGAPAAQAPAGGDYGSQFAANGGASPEPAAAASYGSQFAADGGTPGNAAAAGNDASQFMAQGDAGGAPSDASQASQFAASDAGNPTLGVSGTSVRGLLLAAVQAGTHEAPAWTPLDLPARGLRVYILHAPLRCQVQGRMLALGMSYDELVQVCRLLAGGVAAGGGAIAPTAEIVDAAWQMAKASGAILQPFGLNQKAGDDALMDSLQFAIRQNDNIDRQVANLAPDTFARDYGKDWTVDPSMLRIDPRTQQPHGVAEYGWRLPSGVPLQPEGPGGHDTFYGDYSMLCANVVQLYADVLADDGTGTGTLAPTGQRVDLCDVYDQLFGAVPGMTAEIARFR